MFATVLSEKVEGETPVFVLPGNPVSALGAFRVFMIPALRRSLLSGVLTNAQPTLTLLRMAEANKLPLPPPPTSQESTRGRRAVCKTLQNAFVTFAWCRAVAYIRQAD
ncbi:hypothetical protein BC629DRAFT_1600776 [Irpex lacteus]|nr:hypothetical protein BC629DRAFT_1600776 [Irpex lacteus]